MNYEIVDGVYKGPSHYEGTLNLYRTPITSLGCLKSVKGTLYLSNTPITSLGNLKSVKGNLFLQNTPITTKLEHTPTKNIILFHLN